jgi:predicted dehydrogenase
VKIRGAISGFGNVAARGHLPGWQKLPEVEIVAVHEPVPERRHEALRLIKNVRVYEDLELMLSGERLDFVDVASPPSFHFETARRALEAGAHVLVEKPLCLSLAEFDALESQARKQDRALFCVHNWKNSPAYAMAIASARSGKLGSLRRIEMVRLRTEQAGGAQWRIDPSTGGGGILIDHGWHVFYLMHAIAGSEPQTISARLTCDPKIGIDVEAEISVSFGPDLSGFAYLSWRAPVRRTTALVYGDDALLELTMDQAVLTARTGEITRTVFSELPDDSYHADWFAAVGGEVVRAIQIRKGFHACCENLSEARNALGMMRGAIASDQARGATVALR